MATSSPSPSSKRPWYKRLFRRDNPNDSTGKERTVYVNMPMPRQHHLPQYPPNQIRTAKYTILSFVPKNLFEQFRRAANVYFLLLLILQFIPAVSAGSPGLSALALFTIVLLNMIKDGYEDSKRSASDREANKAPSVVLGNSWVNYNKPPGHMFRPGGILRFIRGDSGAGGTIGGASADGHPAHDGSILDRLDSDIGMDSSEWLTTEWRHLHVGDIVLLKDGDSVPADVLLFGSSDEDATCFVETKNLDGETNLKAKASSPRTSHLTTPYQLATFQTAIYCEPPNSELYKFSGSADISGSREPLSYDNLLLRGSVIRNTDWAVGVVLYTGDDTKIMMNGGTTPSKRSRIEYMLNYQVMSQFCLLFALCMLSAVLAGVYYGMPNSFQALFIVKFETNAKGRSAPLFGFLTFWTSLILYQTVVPISLYVTIEVVKSFQAYFINQDLDMYYPPADLRCRPVSWNLSDDLGQVEYIFSDKTGTLTQNVMVFRQCSIRGRVYGEIVAEDETKRLQQMRDAMDKKIKGLFENPYRQSDKTTFFDTSLYDDLRADDSSQARAVIEFFTVLALCHNAVAETSDPDNPDKVEYKAQSPDEAALVATARDVGFAFLKRKKDQVFCNFLGYPQTYQQLASLEFTSARKRMSVIVRREDGKIMLLAKGADSVIMSRIRPGQDRLCQATLDDLELFANHGLRTLCLGYRILNEDEYTDWRKDYDRAMNSLNDREEEVEKVCDRIEQNLQLIGGTAIEDKLQDGVPETIAQLALAGIKLWVLTGDKTETAINIGYSCNLLNSAMQLVVIKADSPEATREQLERALSEFADTHGDLSYIGGGDGAVSGVQPKPRGAWRRLLRRNKHLQQITPALQHAREIAQHKNRRRGVLRVWDDVRTRNIPVEGSRGGKGRLALKRDAPLGLVIDGESLKYALEEDLSPLLLELAVRCQSVLCCRVSPLQKALVVRMVKDGLGTLCLSIGDGANDVSMIHEANVGVGISGEEGVQAVMASDYAIAQFRFLQKLLLVHGRWSYLRITTMILNFFYKNVVFTISLFWFQIYCQWSVTNFFDYTLIMLYNMLFTSLPPGVLGVFDQDLPAVIGAVVPQLYKRGIYKLEYSMARFWMYIIDALYQSAAITFMVIYTYYFSFTAKENGLDSASRDDMGTVGAFCVVFVTNLYMGLNTRTWTWVMPAAQIIGIGLLLGVFFVYGVIYKTAFSAGAAVRVFAQLDFWLLLVMSIIVCLMPHYLAKFVRSAWHPTDTDLVREIVHSFRKKNKKLQSSSIGSSSSLWSKPSKSTYNGGLLNQATTSPHKEVPFGAIPQRKISPVTRMGHHRASVGHHHHHHSGGGAMEGAIPLNDIDPNRSARTSSYHTAPNETGYNNNNSSSSNDQDKSKDTAGGCGADDGKPVDALNRPGLYQGIRYPESDTVLVNHLHMLAHMGRAGMMVGEADNNILKRLSVRQQQSRQQQHPSVGLEDGEEAEFTPYYHPQQDAYGRDAADNVSLRSSIYYLDDGSLQPHTGYAFAQEERSAIAQPAAQHLSRYQKKRHHQHF